MARGQHLPPLIAIPNAMGERIAQPSNYANVLNTPLENNNVKSRAGDLNVKSILISHNGISAVIFNAKEFNDVMAEECKYTIVGKFLKTRPQIDKIRSRFAEKITLQGQVMWLEKWTSNFKADEDSPIVPVWVLLPELPFHLHAWNYLKQIVRPIGVPWLMDAATDFRTRPSMAKIRVEVDLTKPKLNAIWIGTEDVPCPLKGFTQKIEYENPPKYYRHCKILGHSILQCRRVEQKKAEQERVDGNMGTEQKEEAKGEEKEDITEQQKEDGKNIFKTTKKKTRKKKVPKKRNKVLIKKVAPREIFKRKKRRIQQNRTEQSRQDQVEEGVDGETLDKQKQQSETQQDKDKEGDTQDNPSNMSKTLDIDKRESRYIQDRQEQESRTGLKEVENGQIQSVSQLPSEVRNAPGIELFVDLNYDEEMEQEGRTQNTDSMNEKEKEENKKEQVINKRGRKEERKFGRRQALYIDSSGSRTLRNEQQDTAQSQIKGIGMEFRGRSKGRRGNRRNKTGKERDIITNTDQQITLNLKESPVDGGYFVTFVYAKCTPEERVELWGSIGPKFTWCHYWAPKKRIWMRLDRILVNDEWAEKFQNNIVKHLSRSGSDHRPLLLKSRNPQHDHIKYFKFLSFWTEIPGFLEIVQNCWDKEVNGNAMWKLQTKLKRLSYTLSAWSRHDLGDINDAVKDWEAKVELLEELDIMNNIDQGRQDLNKGHAEYVKWLNFHDSRLKKKTKHQWFNDGDKNTK
ncbi:uncharacterized protein LOC132609505 [Lycium barbarum]|uniref:uncharacterized protein LOC132609505 n=1 Tax=Lycium barbarum TaxID=112863 RepID=UPI00293E780D|nr:uncharacterized protein LOC132609505 [Lycium barbarum]